MAGLFVALAEGVTAEVTRSPEGIRVRYGKLLGGMFVPGVEKFFAHNSSETKDVWRHGWELIPLLALLERHLVAGQQAASAVSALAHRVIGEIRHQLGYSSEPYWPRVLFLLGVLRMLSSPDADVLLEKLARRKGVPKAIRMMKSDAA